jgi:hypothetical protein
MSDAHNNNNKQNGTGIKHDSNKTEYHYLSPIAIEELSKVLTFGAKKYAAHNWRGGMKWSRVLSAAFRHLYAWMRGEDKDPETGLSHLAHCMCCIMFLLEFEVTHKELDDRYKIDSTVEKQISDEQMVNDLADREEIKPGDFVVDKDGLTRYVVASYPYTVLVSNPHGDDERLTKSELRKYAPMLKDA